jgi:hypothetical protein
LAGKMSVSKVLPIKFYFTINGVHTIHRISWEVNNLEIHPLTALLCIYQRAENIIKSRLGSKENIFKLNDAKANEFMNEGPAFLLFRDEENENIVFDLYIMDYIADLFTTRGYKEGRVLRFHLEYNSPEVKLHPFVKNEQVRNSMVEEKDPIRPFTSTSVTNFVAALNQNQTAILEWERFFRSCEAYAKVACLPCIKDIIDIAFDISPNFVKLLLDLLFARKSRENIDSFFLWLSSNDVRKERHDSFIKSTEKFVSFMFFVNE